MRIRDAIGPGIPEELRVAAEQTFAEIQKHFSRRQWKTAGLDSGHFTEAIRRIVDFLLFGNYRPIGRSLKRFDEKLLAEYASASGDEGLRILIPRQLWALYALRNKRSIGHLGVEPAQELDATILLYGSKWVLGELIRLTTDLSEPEAKTVLDQVISRQLTAIWREGDIVRVINPKASAKDKILLLLAFVGDYAEQDLKSTTEYKHTSNFRALLRDLHKKGLIHFDGRLCKITPNGSTEAEKLNDKFASGI